MRISDSQKQHDEELIAHIRHRLQAHEETYVPGAWEKFRQQEVVPPPATVSLWVTVMRYAAILMVVCGIAFSIFLLQKENEEKSGQNGHKSPKAPAFSQTSPSIKAPPATVDQAVISGVTENSSLERNKKHTHSAPNERLYLAAESVREKQQIYSELPEARVLTRQPVLSSRLAEHRPQRPLFSQKSNSIPVTEVKSTILEFLANETLKHAQSSTSSSSSQEQEDKMTVGLMVAPSIGNMKKVNMSYGISMDYQLSARISINSGIAYNELSAEKRVGSAPSYSGLVGKTSKNLEAIEDRVSGLDIPLELKYHLPNGVYANVGVSAFAVLNTSRDRVFIQETVVQSMPSQTVGSSNKYLNNVVVNERNVEKSSEDIADNSFIGFYNFSIGYKKAISKKNAFAIEPFIKVPMKELNKEKLNMMGTGVRLKFDF